MLLSCISSEIYLFECVFYKIKYVNELHLFSGVTNKKEQYYWITIYLKFIEKIYLTAYNIYLQITKFDASSQKYFQLHVEMKLIVQG